MPVCIRRLFDEATTVIEAKGSGGKFFTMSTSGDVTNGNIKLYDNVIFCLSNQNLWTIYEPYYNTDQSLVLAAWDITDIFDAINDTRAQLVKLENSQIYSIKKSTDTSEISVLCQRYDSYDSFG